MNSPEKPLGYRPATKETNADTKAKLDALEAEIHTDTKAKLDALEAEIRDDSSPLDKLKDFLDMTLPEGSTVESTTDVQQGSPLWIQSLKYLKENYPNQFDDLAKITYSLIKKEDGSTHPFLAGHNESGEIITYSD